MKERNDRANERTKAQTEQENKQSRQKVTAHGTFSGLSSKFPIH